MGYAHVTKSNTLPKKLFTPIENKRVRGNVDTPTPRRPRKMAGKLTPEMSPCSLGAVVNWQELRDKAIREALVAFAKANMSKELKSKLFAEDPTNTDLFSKWPQLKKWALAEAEKAEDDEKTERGGLHGLITVNPKEGITGEQLLAEIQELGDRAAIQKLTVCLYTVEHRWEEDLPTGAHVHFYVIRDPDVGQQAKPNKILEAFKAQFADICDVKNKHCLNAVWRKEEQGLLNYVRGIKKKPEKEHRIELDTIWLEKHGLKHAQPLFDEEEEPEEEPQEEKKEK
jgi:hypothetical protein